MKCMLISTKGRYAVRMLLDIATHPGTGVQFSAPIPLPCGFPVENAGGLICWISNIQGVENPLIYPHKPLEEEIP